MNLSRERHSKTDALGLDTRDSRNPRGHHRNALACKEGRISLVQYPSGPSGQPPCSGGEQAVARDNQKPVNRIADFLYWMAVTAFFLSLFCALALAGCQAARPI